MEKTLSLLQNEINHSFEKHGKWDNLPVKKMFDLIEDEFKEVTSAFFKNDNTSNHRLSVELLQVSVCCIKMSEQIRKRYETPRRRT